MSSRSDGHTEDDGVKQLFEYEKPQKEEGKCKKCGVCCELFVVKADGYNKPLVELRKNYLKTIEHEGEEFFVLRIPCKHLDTKAKRCKIYDYRPDVCRTFPEPDGGFWASINPECGYVKEETKDDNEVRAKSLKFPVRGVRSRKKLQHKRSGRGTKKRDSKEHLE